MGVPRNPMVGSLPAFWAIEVRWAEGRRERFAEIAAEPRPA
jgi:hypothetical protein